MGERGHVPIRTCIGCRKKRKKEEMLRFVNVAEQILFVRGKKDLHGRGFYLCPDILCLRMAQKRHKWIDPLQSTGLLDHFVEGLQ